MCLSNFFGDFMMKVFIANDIVLRSTWPSDNDGLNVFQIWKPIGTCMFSRSFEEIVRPLRSIAQNVGQTDLLAGASP